jgi:putative MATE family efflux protein
MQEEKLLMTEGPIGPILFRFALPLFLGNLFQQLYNAVDSLVVGKFCGDAALAAVSSSGSLCNLIIGFFQGTFLGASVIISRRYGARDGEGTDRAVHTTVVFSLCAGVLLSILGVLFTPTILGWMGTPENVMPNSVMYFRVYCAGLLGLVLYNTSTGIFQALGDSRHPLYYLMIAACTNVVLDLLFVAVLGMGVEGAALATVIGQALSALLGFGHLVSGKFVIQLRLSHLKPDKRTLLEIFRLGLPSGVQNSVINIANLVVQSNINAFGDLAMAGCGSYFKVEGFVFLPITCLTMAITTFVSQNIGAQRYDRVKAGAKLGVGMTALLAEVVGVIFFIGAPLFIGLFSSTPEVVAFGVRQARVESLFYCALAFSHAAASVLRGAGKAVTPMVVMLAVWCLFRITYITVMVAIFGNILVVFTAYPVTWCLSSILFSIALWKGNWLSIS